jgi:diguanylate cyclase (GGDEF)-like protein
VEVVKIRKDFQIYVVDDEESIRSILTETLSSVGYPVESFPDAEKALEAIKKEPPHVVLSDIRMPGMSGIDLLAEVKDLSSDIEFIIMTSHASLDTAVNAVKLGAYDYLHKPFDELQEVVTTVDRTVEHLYLRFENEQLLEELNEKNKVLTTLNARILQEKEEVVQINKFMSLMASAVSFDGVTEIYLQKTSELLEGVSGVFLKHLPAYFSLVVSKGIQLSVDQQRKIGISFRDQDPREYIEKLRDPQQLEELRDLLTKVFGITDFTAVPLENEGEVEGVVVFFCKISDPQIKKLFESYTQIFRVSYVNALMQKRIHDMAIKDALTGLHNRRYFNEKLDEEMSRSRRTKLPVSLVYMDIDHFKKYNDQNGHPMGDVLLKMIASILRKTSRKNDIVSRIGGEEFTIILPHTNKIGAAIKAEKLRRTIEGTKFPNGEKQPLGFISMSLGVSEYPSMASDAEGLVKSADEALYRVKETSRNKVCMAIPPEGFEQDFEPLDPNNLQSKVVE